MGISFLAPFVLACVSLLVMPWLIHKIRRPERETLIFSSLMFLPKVKKKVIEKRNIQHILLMLLRMAIVLLMVLAFSRPYRLLANLNNSVQSKAVHLILLDTSYSMGTKNRFQEAKENAIELIRSIPSDEAVGLLAFDSRPYVLMPIFNSQTNERNTDDLAIQAIQKVQLSERQTDYLPALQKAQELLLGNEAANSDDTRYIVHLITDFQKNGMPASISNWKLDSSISLDPIKVGEGKVNLFTISDVHLEKSKMGNLNIRGQVKNWSKDEEPLCKVSLFVDGEKISEKNLYVQAGNTSKVSFSIPLEPEKTYTGWLEIESDSLSLDNKRYFAWNPQYKNKILLVAHETNRRWPASWFILQAMKINQDHGWTLSTIQPDLLSQTLENPAEPIDILLICGLEGIDENNGNTILDYIEDGGHALLMIDHQQKEVEDNHAWLSNLGLTITGQRYEETNDSQYESLSWIDFEHPVFFPFCGSRFNDFSNLRFYNYTDTEVIVDAGAIRESESEIHNSEVGAIRESPLQMPSAELKTIKVLSCFEENKSGNKPAAIVECLYGKGTCLVWTFLPELEWTNIPKTAKFVPLLFETLFYLDKGDKEIRSHRVEDRIDTPPFKLNQVSELIVQLPGNDSHNTFTRDTLKERPITVSRSGFLHWRTPAHEDWIHSETVNIDVKESDLESISIEEFQSKLCSAASTDGTLVAANVTNTSIQDDSSHQKEFGLMILILLLVGLLTESWYASRLAQNKTIEHERPSYGASQ